MNDPHDLIEEETVSRHFDDGNTREETAALGELLARNPETARRFAETARLHALMESMSPHAAANLARRRRFRAGPWLAAAAALIVAGGVAAFILTRPDDSGLTIRASTGDEKTEGPQLPAPPSANVRRVVKQAYGAAMPMTEDLDQILSRWVTNVDPEGKTVREALALLSEEMRGANVLRQPEIDSITYTIGESRIEGEAEPLIRYAYPPPYTVSTFLRICWLHQQFARTPRALPTWAARIFDPKAEGLIENAALGMPPDLLSGIRDVAGSDGAARPTDPSLWLEKMGIPVLKKESALFSPSTSTLHLKAFT